MTVTKYTTSADFFLDWEHRFHQEHQAKPTIKASLDLATMARKYAEDTMKISGENTNLAALRQEDRFLSFIYDIDVQIRESKSKFSRFYWHILGGLQSEQDNLPFTQMTLRSGNADTKFFLNHINISIQLLSKQFFNWQTPAQFTLSLLPASKEEQNSHAPILVSPSVMCELEKIIEFEKKFINSGDERFHYHQKLLLSARMFVADYEQSLLVMNEYWRNPYCILSPDNIWDKHVFSLMKNFCDYFMECTNIVDLESALFHVNKVQSLSKNKPILAVAISLLKRHIDTEKKKCVDAIKSPGESKSTAEQKAEFPSSLSFESEIWLNKLLRMIRAENLTSIVDLVKQRFDEANIYESSASKINAQFWLRHLYHYFECKKSSINSDMEACMQHARLVLHEDIIEQYAAKRRFLMIYHEYLSLEDKKKSVFKMGVYGEPGTGKTSLARSVAKIFANNHGIQSLEINLAGVSNVSQLIGTPLHLVGASPSEIVKFMIANKERSMVIILDELDKASVEVQNMVAKMIDGHFDDDYFKISIDMSQVYWIVLYNSKDKIEKHLQSRLSKSIHSEKITPQGYVHYLTRLLQKKEYDVTAQCSRIMELFFELNYDDVYDGKRSPREMAYSIEDFCTSIDTVFNFSNKKQLEADLLLPNLFSDEPFITRKISSSQYKQIFGLYKGLNLLDIFKSYSAYRASQVKSQKKFFFLDETMIDENLEHKTTNMVAFFEIHHTKSKKEENSAHEWNLMSCLPFSVSKIKSIKASLFIDFYYFSFLEEKEKLSVCYPLNQWTKKSKRTYFTGAYTDTVVEFGLDEIYKKVQEYQRLNESLEGILMSNIQIEVELLS